MKLYDLTGAASQKWLVTPNADGMAGLSTIMSVTGREYIDVDNAGTTNGTRVQLFTGNGTLAQKWRIEILDNGTASFDRIVLLHSALKDSMVLDCVNGGTANGTQLDIFTSNGTKAQKWTFVWAGEPYTYFIVNAGSGKALDAS